PSGSPWHPSDDRQTPQLEERIDPGNQVRPTCKAGRAGVTSFQVVAARSHVRGAITIPSTADSGSWFWSAMRAFIPGRLVRSPAGALLALLACALSAPSKAQAGCSHYVIYRSGQDHLVRFLDPLVIGETERPPAESSPPAVPERPRRCSGPTCSG